jgi:dephospho-CoA kinase
MIICITGMPGSGKSTAAAILKRKGFKIIEMSDFAREIMREKHMKIRMKSLAEFANQMKKESGMDVLARLTAKKVSARGDTVINGIRNMEEIKCLKKRFGSGLLIIAITAPPRLRYNRLHDKRSNVESYKEFLWREKDEKFKGTVKVLDTADIIVANAGTRAELRSDIEKAVKIASCKLKARK